MILNDDNACYVVYLDDVMMYNTVTMMYSDEQ